MRHFVLIGGSFEYYRTWYLDRTAPFLSMMFQQGFTPIAPPFRWNGGVLPVDWCAASDAMFYLLRDVPYEDRNIIAYSNGGQVALEFAARWRFSIRTLTTVGTPCRFDVPVDLAEDYIAYHQQIYDERDPIKQLGEWDWPLGCKREFAEARNYNMRDTWHGGVFFVPMYIRYWVQMGWLDAIRYLATPVEGMRATNGSTDTAR